MENPIPVQVPSAAPGPEPVVPSAPAVPPPAPAAAPPAGRPHFDALLKRAFAIWKAQWWKLAALGAIPFALAWALAFGAQAAKDAVPTGAWLAAILAMLLVMVVLGARVGAAQIRLALGADARMGLGEAWKATGGMALSIVWIGLLTALVTLGGYLLVIPGIIWSVSFAFAPYVRVRDGLRGRDALVRSRQLVKGDWWWVVLRSFVFGLVLVLISAPIAVAEIVLKSSAAARATLDIATNVLNLLVLAPLGVGFVTAMFEALSSLKEAAPMPRAKGVYAAAAVAGLLMPIAVAAAGWSFVRFLLDARPAAQLPLTVPESVTEAQEATPGAPATEGAANEAQPDDRDGDGMTDRNEAFFDTDPENPDTDGDGLGDFDEKFRILTSPTEADTDNDGYDDGDEIMAGFDPKAAGQPLSEAYRSNIIRYYEMGEYHEPTLTTLRPLLP